MASDILNLDRSSMIAEGGEREVYLHPDQPFRLIKVLKPRSREEFTRWTFGHLTQRYFPSTRIRPTIKQYDEYRRLMLGRELKPDFDLPISHLYGFVKTNLGLGCITEQVTDPNDGLAPTLEQRIQAGTFTQADLDGLNAFVTHLYDISICAADLGPANFVFGHRHIGAAGVKTEQKWVLIDGFGDRFAVPIRSISATARRLGLDDSFKRSKKVAGLEWDPAERRYHL